MFRQAVMITAAFFLLAPLGLAQDNRYDAGLSVGGALTKQSSGNGTVQTATNSGVFLGTARVRFTEHSSVEVNFARTKDSQNYISSPFQYRIQGSVTEFSGAYVFSFFQTKRLEPFLFGGAAVLVFSPKTTLIDGVAASLPASSQNRPAALYGGGADYIFYRSFAVRLQYRGLVYKAPSFNVANLFTGAYGHLAEPSVGIVFKF
jgi:outer membrane immunogenic protein